VGGNKPSSGAAVEPEPTATPEPSDTCPLIEEVPFDSVTWVGDPCIDLPCTYRREQWQNVRRWCHLMMQAAEIHGLDEILEANGFDLHLFAALMWIESKGNPTAHSSAMATGLLQVMPAEAPGFAGRPTIKELEDPEFNLDYGTNLLMSYIDEKDGSLQAGLNRYYGCSQCKYYDLIVWLNNHIKSESQP
jgi:hypothetical protein